MTNVDAEAGGDADSGGDADAIGDPDDHAHAHADAHADAGTGDFDPQRRLCDDGSCVGVIGPDGTCRVCGRRAEG